MDEAGAPYPSVFVVDGCARGPPVPPRLRSPKNSGRSAQTLLFLMVSLLLAGVVIEGVFIFRLHHPDAAESQSAFKIIQDKGHCAPKPTERTNPTIPPSKPVAHLTGGHRTPPRLPPREDQVVLWSADASNLLYKMKYKRGKLYVEQEGYYYIYSKVHFSKDGDFSHSVCRLSPSRHSGGCIYLMESRKDRAGSGPLSSQSNSFLGGVFHLNKGDAVLVKVNDAKQIILFRPYDNFFGAYMI